MRVKSSYGGNLVAQRDVIKRLEAEIETLKKGKDEKKKKEKTVKTSFSRI